jgi:hypothetical protein
VYDSWPWGHLGHYAYLELRPDAVSWVFMFALINPPWDNTLAGAVRLRGLNGDFLLPEYTSIRSGSHSAWWHGMKCFIAERMNGA